MPCVWRYSDTMRSDDIYKEVGRNIRRYRASICRTQARLAAEIGISRASLANIEAGRQKVLLHYLYDVADALDLASPSVLMPAPSPRKVKSDDLPLPVEGLSETQRQEVLSLMSGVLQNSNKPETDR